MKQHPFTQQELIKLLTFLLEETKRQNPTEFEKRLRDSEFDFNPVPSEVRNTMQWIGSENSFRSFAAFNTIHKWIIADDENHFREHFMSDYLPASPLVMGDKNNDVYFILKGLHKKRLLRIYDVWHGVIFEHFVDKYALPFDRNGSLKTAVNKKPLILNAERETFLNSIINQIAFDDR